MYDLSAFVQPPFGHKQRSVVLLGHRLGLLGGVAAVALLAVAPPGAHAASAKLTAKSTIDRVSFSGRIAGRVARAAGDQGRWRVRLEQRTVVKRTVRGQRRNLMVWRIRASAKVVGGARRFSGTWRPPTAPATYVVRGRVTAGGRTIATSPARTVRLTGVKTPRPNPRIPTTPAVPAAPVIPPRSMVQPHVPVTPPTPVVPAPVNPPAPTDPTDPPAPDGPFTVPQTTRLYESEDVSDVGPGETDDEAVLTLGASEPVPQVGGHVAVGPSANLPDGMFATVKSVEPVGGGGVRAVVVQAAIDEVLDNVNVSYDGPGEASIVDAEGRPTSDPSPLGADGALTFRGTATARTSSRTSTPEGMFTCGESGGIPRKPDDLWSTGNPFPVELKIENRRVIHNFDTGSVLLGRPPNLLFQFSGEAVAKIGVKAKTGFKCELSTTYRRAHRLRFHVANIGPVPVSVNLEPHFSFEVSASGSISVSQRHYFSFTFEKRGSDAPSFRRGSSKDAPTWDIGAQVDASLFAGGDLSVMVGGGYKSANAQAGIYGAFGPEFSLNGSSQRPTCVSADVTLRADLGVRLELWVKRWGFQLASLTLAGQELGEWCVFDSLDESQYRGSWNAFDVVKQDDGSLSLVSRVTLTYACGRQVPIGTTVYRNLRPDPSGQYFGESLYSNCGSYEGYEPLAAMRTLRRDGQVVLALAGSLWSPGVRPTIDSDGTVSPADTSSVSLLYR